MSSEKADCESVANSRVEEQYEMDKTSTQEDSCMQTLSPAATPVPSLPSGDVPPSLMGPYDVVDSSSAKDITRSVSLTDPNGGAHSPVENEVSAATTFLQDTSASNSGKSKERPPDDMPQQALAEGEPKTSVDSLQHTEESNRTAHEADAGISEEDGVSELTPKDTTAIGADEGLAEKEAHATSTSNEELSTPIVNDDAAVPVPMSNPIATDAQTPMVQEMPSDELSDRLFDASQAPGCKPKGQLSSVVVLFVGRTANLLLRASSPGTPLHTASQRCLELINSQSSHEGETDLIELSSCQLPDQQTPLVLEDALVLVEPLKLACLSQQHRLMEPALDCLHKVIAHGCLQLESSPTETSDSDEPRKSGDSVMPKQTADKNTAQLASEVLKAICEGVDSDHAGVQLASVKAVLTAATSDHFRLHGEALLRAVTMCYTMTLGSQYEPNRFVARNALLQMVVTAFKRLESDITNRAAATAGAGSDAEVEKRGDAPTAGVFPLDVDGTAEPCAAAACTLAPVAEEGFANGNGAEEPPQEGNAAVEAEAQAPSSAELTKLADEGDISQLEKVLDRTHSLDQNLEDLVVSDPTDTTCLGIGDRSKVVADEEGEVPGGEAPTAQTTTANSQNSGGDAQVPGGPRSLAPPPPPQQGPRVMGRAAEKDALMVLRALCRLSAQGGEARKDDLAMQGKAVALQLLKSLLGHISDYRNASVPVLMGLRQHLCLALLHNCLTPVPAIYSLVCDIFQNLVLRFRSILKTELGIFFPLIALRPLEMIIDPSKYAGAVSAVAESVQRQRVDLSLKMLLELCKEPQVLVDLYVNYDCDMEAANLFERTLLTLVDLLQKSPGVTPSSEGSLHLSGVRHTVQCLHEALSSLHTWASYTDPAEEACVEGPGAESKSESQEVETLKAAKERKLTLAAGLAAFNNNPVKGLRLLQASGVVGPTPVDAAHFLRTTPGLDKTLIGELLGHHEDAEVEIMHAFVQHMDFTPFPLIDEALRQFLAAFRLPGESQKIDRLMEQFAYKWCQDNPTIVKSVDTAHVLAFSVIMLNTDAHNPMSECVLTKESFIEMNTSTEDSKDLDPEYLAGIFHRIQEKEIDVLGEPGSGADQGGVKGGKGGWRKNSRRGRLVGVLSQLNPMSRRAADEAAAKEAQAVRETTRSVFQKHKQVSVFYAAAHRAHARPMLDSVGWKILEALGQSFEATSHAGAALVCLEGVAALTRLASATHNPELRKAGVAFLVKASKSDSPRPLVGMKHMEAVLMLLELAALEGYLVQESWPDVLKAVSQLDQMLLLDGKGSKVKSDGADAPGDVGEGPDQALRPEVMQRVRQWMEEAGREAVERVYSASERLDLESTVLFVHALVEVSMTELFPQANHVARPRIFSLQKLVEVCELNIQRIRVIWARVWPIVASHLVAAGGHTNANLAMYAVDALRQLANRLLVKGSAQGGAAAHHLFQSTLKEALWPFRELFGSARVREVRELLVQSVVQLLKSHWAGAGAGWHALFMFFSKAGKDPALQVAELALTALEPVPVELFRSIPAECFADCVNCFAVFAQHTQHLHLSMRALDCLAACGHRLMEAPSELRQQLEDSNSTSVPSLSNCNGTDAGANQSLSILPGCNPPTVWETIELHFLPLMASLAEGSSDARPEMRQHSVQVLFALLLAHGGELPAEFWRRLIASVLLPLFDYERHSGLFIPATMPQPGAKSPETAQARDPESVWTADRCQLLLRSFCQLAATHHRACEGALLPLALERLRWCLVHESVHMVECGMDAFKVLVQSSQTTFCERDWEVMVGFLEKLPSSVSQPAVSETAGPKLDTVSTRLFDDSEAYSKSATATNIPQDNSDIDQGSNGDNGSSNPKLPADCADMDRASARKYLAYLQLVVHMLDHMDEKPSEGMKLPKCTIKLLDMLRDGVTAAASFNADLPSRIALSKKIAGSNMHAPSLLHQEVECGVSYLRALLKHGAAKFNEDGEILNSFSTAQSMIHDRTMQMCTYVLSGVNSHRGLQHNPVDTRSCDARPVVKKPEELWLVWHERAVRTPLVVAALEALVALPTDVFVQRAGGLVRPISLLIANDDSSANAVRAAVSAVLARYGTSLI